LCILPLVFFYKCGIIVLQSRGERLKTLIINETARVSKHADCGVAQKNSKKFEKPLDNSLKVWYNNDRVKERRK
jgi:hypothetical protein